MELDRNGAHVDHTRLDFRAAEVLAIRRLRAEVTRGGQHFTTWATATSRALALLRAFDATHRRLSLTEMANRAELPLPTAHRLVKALEAWGLAT
jgi:IclR-like helix-turn-helix domain-containing protein